MPTSLPPQRLRDPSPSSAQIVAILSAYTAMFIVVIGLVYFDVRVALWLEDAAQAEYIDAEPVDQVTSVVGVAEQ